MNRREKILSRLREIGSRGPKRSLGQNFLVSERVIERILFAVNSLESSELIEIGPGLGALTDDLIALGRPLTLIELDRDFAEMWRERAVKESVLIKIVEGDALKISWTDLGLSPGALLVSNLPYQISSSVVIDRCLQPVGITRMILMFQKEVASRVSAQPASKEYGLLTVMSQVFWQTKTVCDASGQDFFPPPNVSSRVLEFRQRPTDWLRSPPESPPTAQGFLKFVKAAFSHRRKLLSRNLLNGYLSGRGEGDGLAGINEIFSTHGLLPTARAEELDPDAFVRLYLSLRET